MARATVRTNTRASAVGSPHRAFHAERARSTPGSSAHARGSSVARGALLREMWKSAGVWVESKSAAWSEVEGDLEVVAEVAPRAGDRVPG